MARKKKMKRANGEGTFYQRDDNMWTHQITLGRKPDGKPDRKTFTGKTRAECLKKREKYEELKVQHDSEEDRRANEYQRIEEEARRRGHSLESEIIFQDAFPVWLKTYKATTKKPTTYTSYLDIYGNHFKPHFGEMSLYAITTDCLQQYYNEKQKNGSRRDKKAGGLAAKTIRNHHMLLFDFFRYSCKKYKLAENPTEDVELPKVLTQKRRVLTADEMKIFLTEVLRETQRVAILTDLFTGLRIGELLALEVTDIDVEKQGINVSRNITRVSTESIDMDNPNITILGYRAEKKTHLVIQNSPKTDKSNRFVPISDELFQLIAKHLFYLKQSFWPNPKNLLFPSAAGTHIDPRSFGLRLEAVSERCRIRNVNPHAMRHTFATRLIEQDVPITTVKELLGHASISTTQLYVTTFDGEKRDAIDSISVYLDPSKIDDAQKLSGTKNRMRFNEVRLPSWLQQEPQKPKLVQLASR